MKVSATVALFLSGSLARHHHHHHNNEMIQSFEEDMEALNAMSDSRLVSSLETTLHQALALEAKDDTAAAVAKTAAIKNIQKALTARILKRLDDGQPLVEVARKMKAIEGMQPQINDMERRLGIMQSVEPVLENAIKTLQKVVDVRGMGKTLVQLEESQGADIIIEKKDDVVGEVVKDSEPLAVAKAEVALKAAAEANTVVDKQEAAAAKASAEAMANEVVSKVDPAIAKKEKAAAEKEEKKAKEEAAKAFEKEEAENKKLIDEWKAA